MKTATITWVSYNNYGTLLQAYALQKCIEKLGYENVVISDEEILKEYKQNKKRKTKNNSFQQDTKRRQTIFERIFGLLKTSKRLKRVLLAHFNRDKYEEPYYGTQESCDKFKAEMIKCRYGENLLSLEKLNLDYDTFVCGSDQVWSVFEDIFNPYYFLDFVSKKKVAYAPCLGTDIISTSRLEEIKELLEDFYAISVRESISAKQLSKVVGRNVEWVCDPTLLHDKEFWSKFTSEVQYPKKKYLLCYFLENRDWYFEYAREVAKKLKLSIILVPNKWDFLSNEYVTEDGIGPQEFVSLIQHAEYVLTDSYHGSIFSLIFEKNFQYLMRFANDDPESQNIRIQSLFEYLNLNERIVTKDNMKVDSLLMSYEKITDKIEVFRNKSKKYLEEALCK